MHKGVANPFTFGALALDEAFTDREDELHELGSDIRNGQDVLVYAPRRYGKSSLVLRAAQEAIRRNVLIGYCDLMKTPTKEKFAAVLAKTIYSDIASPVDHALERAASLFRGLRIRPAMEVDPDDATLRFSFEPGRRKSDIDDTIEKLLELPAELAAERKRRVAVIFDEFQEIVALDKRFPNLMRAVFQAQPEVGHVYLGSKRHILERIFSDENEPFWRSAKRLEIGMISPAEWRPFIRQRFSDSDKEITDEALKRLLAATGGHPYATQELAYFIWELVPTGHRAHDADVEQALGKALRSEHNHFANLWDDATHHQRLLMLALSEEPSSALYSESYHGRHELPSNPSLQRALGGLVRKEIVGRNEDGDYCVIEPFLAEWLEREQSGYDVAKQLRATPPGRKPRRPSRPRKPHR
jgi:AAA+ ATPase superfamily predicted ATPase